MKSFKTILIPVRVDEGKDFFEYVRSLPFVQTAHIHLIHFVKLSNLFDQHIFDAYIPSAEGRALIEQSVLQKLAEMKGMLELSRLEERVTFECVFTDGIKQGLNDYIQNSHYDLILIPARKKKHWSGSFIRHQLENNPVPKLIVKNHLR